MRYYIMVVVPETRSIPSLSIVAENMFYMPCKVKYFFLWLITKAYLEKGGVNVLQSKLYPISPSHQIYVFQHFDGNTGNILYPSILPLVRWLENLTRKLTHSLLVIFYD